MRIRLLLATLSVGTFLTTSIAFAEDVVRIATEGAYPPFNYMDSSGKAAGFDVDIANAICETAKWKCEIVVQDWDGIIPGLLADKYDAIVASMSMTPERAEVVAFSDKYAKVPNHFVMSDALADKVAAAPGEGLEQLMTVLEGKVIGLVAATAAEPYVRDKFGDRVQYRGYQKMEDALQDLVAGRIDAYADGAVPITENFLKKDAGKGFKLAGAALDDPKYFGSGNGIAVRKEDTKLLSEINAALKTIRENGTYAKINGGYFSFDIYGE